MLTRSSEIACVLLSMTLATCAKRPFTPAREASEASQVQADESGAPSESEERAARKEYPTETLYQLWRSSLKDRTAAARFVSSLSERHIIEPIAEDPDHVLVTYFMLGSSKTAFVLQGGGPDFYGLRFKRLGQTDLYYCTQKIPSDAMFIYGFNEFTIEAAGDSRVAATTMEHVYDAALVAPQAPLSPYVEASPEVAAGEVVRFELPSKYLNESRSVLVYTPANYREDVACNIVFFFDGMSHAAKPNHGAAWEGWTPAPTILDNLIAEQRIAPTIAIMVLSEDDRDRFLISDQMTDFVALELLPWVREHYKTTPDPTNVIVSGLSRGGFAAANTARRHPNRIGGVLSQSGSFWITADPEENWPIYPKRDGKVILDYKASPRLPIRFYLSAGLYDLGAGIVGTNRQLRDILELKGYEVEHREYNGGHAFLNWRHDLANGLISLLGEPRPPNTAPGLSPAVSAGP
ncbi:MAG: esterase family protein [Myxococcales bacterium FL481]|nr:MAG: esterase family protein [Myxococcales bacterium FL481]